MSQIKSGFLRTSAHVLMALAAAVVCTAALASIVQTQVNLAALSKLGADITVGTRLHSSWFDLYSFAPTFAALVAAAFIPAFCVRAILMRWLPHAGLWLAIAAGAAAIWTMLFLMQQLLGLHVIAGARTAVGLVLMIATGALGGWVYALVRRRQMRGG